MEIDGISNKLLYNNTDNVKRQVDSEDFEKRLQAAVNKNDEQELKKVCREFESILLSLMYKQMKATVPKSELIPGDAARDIFESMLDDKLMEEASQKGGMGLGDALYKQLDKRLKSVYKIQDEGE